MAVVKERKKERERETERVNFSVSESVSECVCVCERVSVEKNGRTGTGVAGCIPSSLCPLAHFGRFGH